MESEEARRARFSQANSEKVRGTDIPHRDLEDAPTGEVELIAALVVTAGAIGIGVALASNKWAADEGLIWLAAHPEMAGAIAFFIALVLGRTYIFMRRLESR